MSQAVFGSDEYARFRDFLEDACGISLGDDKAYLVRSRLGGLLAELALPSLGALMERMRADTRTALRARVIDAMTTNETLWFRDSHPFDILKEHLLPVLGAAGRPIRIWSAGCSSGQEPYSISMTLEELKRERPGLLKGPVEILGTDVSPSMLAQAREGRYPDYSIRRGLSDERRNRYFVRDGDAWRLRDELRVRVRFSELNLLHGFAALGRFDVVLCRNVLIYFSPERKADILARIAAVIPPGGHLLLGGTESVPAQLTQLRMVRLGRGLAYQRV